MNGQNIYHHPHPSMINPNNIINNINNNNNNNNSGNNNDNNNNEDNNHYLWNLSSYLTSSTLEVPGTNFEKNNGTNYHSINSSTITTTTTNTSAADHHHQVGMVVMGEEGEDDDNEDHYSNKKFKCDYDGCSYSANFQSRLNQHKTNHVLDKVIKCDIEGCHFSTKRYDSLRKHKLNHSFERPFKCDFEGCSYSGITTDALNRHKLKHSLERKFKCDFDGCTFAAKRLQNLNKHKLIHIPVKEFKCDFDGCTFATRRMVNLNNHKLKHSTERQFKCHYEGCLFDSKWRCALNRHIKVEHNPEPKLNCDLFADFLIPFHEEQTMVNDKMNNSHNNNNMIITPDFVINDSDHPEQEEDFFDDSNDPVVRLTDSSDSSASAKDDADPPSSATDQCKQEVSTIVAPNQFSEDSPLDFSQAIKMAKHLYGCIDKLRDLNIRIQEVESGLFVARFLWSTLEFRIRFGPPDKALNISTDHLETKQIREIIRLDVKSLINPKKKLPQGVMSGHDDEPLYDGDDYDLKFQEEHRSILLMANHYVLLHFGEQRKQFMQKYRNSSELSQLLTEFSELVSRARKLALEIRTIYSSEQCKIIATDNSGKFRLSIKLLAINKPIKVQFSFDPFKYPDEYIRPTIVIPECDKHLYPLNEFVSALTIIKPGNFNYIRALIRAAHCFVKLLMIEMEPNKPNKRKKRRTRAEMLAESKEKNKNRKNINKRQKQNEEEEEEVDEEVELHKEEPQKETMTSTTTTEVVSIVDQTRIGEEAQLISDVNNKQDKHEIDIINNDDDNEDVNNNTVGVLCKLESEQ